MFSLDTLLRANIKALTPYSSARDEFKGVAEVYLDANENPFSEPFNRYPDPYQLKLKAVIGDIKQIAPSHIFLGNGSDEPIDLLFRALCEPSVDNVVSIDPTYGMYQVSAEINNVAIKKVALTPDFQIDVDAVLKAVDDKTKMIWLCSPNNPTGNCLKREDILKLINSFAGVVVVDEAYIDFAPDQTFLNQLDQYPNLVILQTFSKAWGMAGLRLGMAFASTEIIEILTRIKYPYNLSMLTQQTVLDLLIKNRTEKDKWVKTILEEREVLIAELGKIKQIIKIYPTDSNFVLVKIDKAREIYNFLCDNKIIIRDRSKVRLCDNTLRITIGTPKENKRLLEALDSYYAKDAK